MNEWSLSEDNLSIADKNITTKLMLIGGRVQAVGYRPFIYRLAKKYELSGSVHNQGGIVQIIAQGKPHALESFLTEALHQAPPLAKPQLIRCDDYSPIPASDFQIFSSTEEHGTQIHIPPDNFLCDDCLTELFNPNNRRYQYPLISCTQCGPRYSIIQKLPYDRANTSMIEHALCPDCLAEYQNPNDRRLHAETISCHQCGPQLAYYDKKTRPELDNQAIIDLAIEQLKSGKILAVKGIGGYHLLCDAMNQNAVARLRERKHRPQKPFAVMLPLNQHEQQLAKHCKVTAEELELLQSPQRPIVLLEKSQTFGLSESIAPDLSRVGILFPYSPLHVLLSEQFAGPLVATSGNRSGEPVVIDNREAENTLGDIADAFIHHNRTIKHPVDDSVFHTMNNKPQPLRLGRGATPLELTLPMPIEVPTLALGALDKNTIALAWDNHLVISPHIGDMRSPKSLRLMEATVEHLQNLYHVKIQKTIHDAHPDYTNHRWARKQATPHKAVFHHYAHASALAYEKPQVKRWCMFTWDGTGFGEDNTIWGGETLIGAPGIWQRVASLKPFYLNSSDDTKNRPLLTALSLCWEADIESELEYDPLVKHAWQRKINYLPTTSMGRLFDAAAALIGVTQTTSFDGHAPMILEAVGTNECEKWVDIPLIYSDKRQVWEADWRPLLSMLRDNSLPASQRSACFHYSLARMILQKIVLLQENHEFNAIGFTGGVFQNQLLCRYLIPLLHQQSITYYFHQHLPANDAAICVGQIMEQLTTYYEN